MHLVGFIIKKFVTMHGHMNGYKRVKVSYFVYTICLLPVSATLVAILREVHYKGKR